jgi:hypothetical protein
MYHTIIALNGISSKERCPTAAKSRVARESQQTAIVRKNVGDVQFEHLRVYFGKVWNIFCVISCPVNEESPKAKWTHVSSPTG